MPDKKWNIVLDLSSMVGIFLVNIAVGQRSFQSYHRPHLGLVLDGQLAIHLGILLRLLYLQQDLLDHWQQTYNLGIHLGPLCGH